VGDPMSRPLWVYLPWLRRCPATTLPWREHPSGIYRAARYVAQPGCFSQKLSWTGRRTLCSRGHTALYPRLGRLPDIISRQPVHRMTGHRALSQLSLREIVPGRCPLSYTHPERSAPDCRQSSCIRICGEDWQPMQATLSSRPATCQSSARRPVLRDHYDGSYEKFRQAFRSRPAFSKDTGAILNEWAMAACYSADADGTASIRQQARFFPKFGSAGSVGTLRAWIHDMEQVCAPCRPSISTRRA
jgi:hypothetical protein